MNKGWSGRRSPAIKWKRLPRDAAIHDLWQSQRLGENCEIERKLLAGRGSFKSLWRLAFSNFAAVMAVAMWLINFSLTRTVIVDDQALSANFARVTHVN